MDSKNSSIELARASENAYKNGLWLSNLGKKVSLDPTTIVSSLLGSLIAMIAAIVVALLYIRNHNKLENEKRVNERIQETYFEQGILPTQAALSEYGTSAVYAIFDLRLWAARCFKLHGSSKTGLKLFQSKINEIVRRPTIKNLSQRDYQLATKCLPSLLTFGTPLYAAIKKTLNLYSRLLSDILNPEVVQRNINESDIAEFERASLAVVNMINAIDFYLETRLTNLMDHIWQKKFESYVDFQNTFHQQEYKNFLSNLKQYLKLMEDWQNALSSPKGEDRERTSKALSNWLVENNEINPFQVTKA